MYLCSLIIAACLICRAHAQAEPDPDPIFEILDPPAIGSCNKDVVVPQIRDMQSTGSLSASQLTGLRKSSFASAYTAPLAALFVEFGPGQSAGQLLGVVHKRLRAYVRSTDEFLTAPRPTMLFGLSDRRHLVLCGDDSIEQKRATDQVPWGPTSSTIGGLFGSGDADDWFFYVPQVDGLARVPKTTLPPSTGSGDEPPDEHSAPPSCADPDTRLYSLIATRFRATVHDYNKRAVFVLCDAYFTTGKIQALRDPLPNTLDLSFQPLGTGLDRLEPVWLVWFAEVVKLAPEFGRRAHRAHRAIRIIPKPAHVRWLPDYYQHWPHLGGLQKASFRDESVTAVNAVQCMLLAAWQGAAERSKVGTLEVNNLPGLNNAGNIAWFCLTVKLQIDGAIPQSWATGYAGDPLPPDAYAPPGSDDDDDDDDGAGSGVGDEGNDKGAGGGRKRPDDGGLDGDHGHQKRPRVGAGDNAGDDDCDNMLAWWNDELGNSGL